MFKRIATLTLFLICAVSIFAQIPPDQENDQKKTLIYNESIDKSEKEYTWGISWGYTHLRKGDYILNYILQNGEIFFLITESGVPEKPTNVSNEKLAIQNDLDNKLNKEKREKELAKMISDALKRWFTDTATTIRNAGRTQEFADILPLLDKAVKPIRINNNLKDYIEDSDSKSIVLFYFITEEEMHKKCSKRSSGCSFINKVIVVNPYIKQKSSNFTKDKVFIHIFHEIGHLYGLADQYKRGTWDVDEEYSTTDRVDDKNSVMAANYSSHLSCDDVDGFINLIDFTISKQKRRKFPGILKKGWSDRAKNGWASFCNGNAGYKDTYYKEAKPVQSL